MHRLYAIATLIKRFELCWVAVRMISNPSWQHEAGVTLDPGLLNLTGDAIKDPGSFPFWQQDGVHHYMIQELSPWATFKHVDMFPEIISPTLSCLIGSHNGMFLPNPDVRTNNGAGWSQTCHDLLDWRCSHIPLACDYTMLAMATESGSSVKVGR